MIWVLLAALSLGGCGVAQDEPHDSGPPDYRYRLTVEVDTPEGVRSGSSVIEVTQRLGRSGASPAHQAVYRRLQGKAVAVDLPDNRVLFALLRSDDNIEWASYVMQDIAPDIEWESWSERLDNMLLLEGPQDLPRYWPRAGKPGTRSALPMLVTFGELDDPTSVERVDPDDFAASFGEGVSLKRIRVQMTDDPVTTGIEERLGWLPNYYDKMLDGQRLNSVHAEHRLANDLSQGAFSKGILQ
ncbi:hypothetical protein [Aurantiacibacter rhizosphaerae]|uniref:Uncharacterized protein n=1 Tax=Aurantiacibacter rhizosphaerae TaxID=2691582 RepID=A0A844XGN8_9SPHN|nr:hypothetical protein [Aurantiacibacter rhizosphaerae]MWV28738.1 hypothetical protein [Aurantiacibacter rhizosphaerae]